MSDGNLNVKIKIANTTQIYHVSISSEATVREFKEACAAATNVGMNEMNLVFKGKILSNDRKLNEYDIQNENQIILVRKIAEAEPKIVEQPSISLTENISSSGEGNKKPEEVKMGSGGVSQEKNAEANQEANLSNQGSNQDFEGFGQGFEGYDQAFEGFGQGSAGSGQGTGGVPGSEGLNPSQLGGMMNNPMYMLMLNEMLSDPSTMNMLMNHPMVKPLIDSNPEMKQLFSNPQMLQAMLMNPQNMQNAMDILGGPSDFNDLGAGQAGTSASQVDPKVLYLEQNKQLKDMGFSNDDMNFEALQQTEGDVQAAVEILINRMN